MAALLLAGCQTSQTAYNGGSLEPSAGSQVNIASLTTVIEQNPSDASAYNVRGSAYGRSG
jgi:hypothetical protein